MFYMGGRPPTPKRTMGVRVGGPGGHPTPTPMVPRLRSDLLGKKGQKKNIAAVSFFGYPTGGMYTWYVAIYKLFVSAPGTPQTHVFLIAAVCFLGYPMGFPNAEGDTYPLQRTTATALTPYIP